MLSSADIAPTEAELVEKVKREIAKQVGDDWAGLTSFGKEWYEDAALAIIPIVTEAERERCARIAESAFVPGGERPETDAYQVRRNIAAAIRTNKQG